MAGGRHTISHGANAWSRVQRRHGKMTPAPATSHCVTNVQRCKKKFLARSVTRCSIFAQSANVDTVGRFRRGLGWGVVRLRVCGFHFHALVAHARMQAAGRWAVAGPFGVKSCGDAFDCQVRDLSSTLWYAWPCSVNQTPSDALPAYDDMHVYMNENPPQLPQATHVRMTRSMMERLHHHLRIPLDEEQAWADCACQVAWMP